uniref:Uncharacterized protein n=1 Tax=Pararge aegeria TaxID=116150 RepID=S4NPL8_9NEOP
MCLQYTMSTIRCQRVTHFKQHLMSYNINLTFQYFNFSPVDVESIWCVKVIQLPNEYYYLTQSQFSTLIGTTTTTVCIH